MAMIAPMKIVPQNNGIEPNAPDDPAWSARIAVCGLHWVPNRKSAGGTMLKKRNVSNISDKQDAERGQDRDQRCADQQPHHPAFDAGARAERHVGAPDSQESGKRRKRDGQRSADRRKAALLFEERRSHFGRLRVEAELALARSDLARLAEDRVALHLSGGQATAPPARTALRDRPAPVARSSTRQAATAPGPRSTAQRASRGKPAASAAGRWCAARGRAGTRPTTQTPRSAGQRPGRRSGSLLAPPVPAYFRPAGSSGLSALACWVAPVASAPLNGTRPRFSSEPPLPHARA